MVLWKTLDNEMGMPTCDQQEVCGMVKSQSQLEKPWGFLDPLLELLQCERHPKKLPLRVIWVVGTYEHLRVSQEEKLVVAENR